MISCQSVPQSHSAEEVGAAAPLLYQGFGNHFIFEATFLTVNCAGWTRSWTRRILENDW